MSCTSSTLQAPSHLLPGKAVPLCGLAVQRVRQQLLLCDWLMCGTCARCLTLCCHVRRLLPGWSAYDCYMLEAWTTLHGVRP